MKKAAVAALVMMTVGGCSGHRVMLSEQAPPTFSTEPPGHEVAEVTRVVDGDTIEVRVTDLVPGAGAGDVVPGAHYDVRLIGIDTPESVHPAKPVECFAREAATAAAALLDGETVHLVRDVEDRDRYGRLLRYVYLGDEMANARLVVNGYAYAYTYPPNVRHAALFVALQRDARGSERGLWAAGACAGSSKRL